MNDLVPFHASVDIGLNVDEDLGMHDALRMGFTHVLIREILEIFLCLENFGRFRVDIEELVEIHILFVGCPLGTVGVLGKVEDVMLHLHAVSFCDLEQKFRSHGTFDVHMELDTAEGVQELLLFVA